ncbi:MAG: hypothetical protein ACM34K_21350 [Bacillota bacterium]
MYKNRNKGFTYLYYSELLKTIIRKYEITLLGDFPADNKSKPLAIIRHDVDVSIECALKMAELEAGYGVSSTYMFIPHSRLYDIRAKKDLIKQFIDLHHEVALHFEIDDQLRKSIDIRTDDIIGEIEKDCKIITDITGIPVRSISFHRPVPQFLRGELNIAGLVNAYAAELMETYISDSKGEWRSGDPTQFVKSTNAQILQLLVHPIWWGEEYLTAGDRLEQFLKISTKNMSSAECKDFDSELALTLPSIQRTNYKEK